MENWKNQQDIKQKLDRELAGIVSGEEKIKEIINLANMEELVETGDAMNGGIIMMKDKKSNRSVKTIFKVAMIAAAISVVSVGTVFGYEYFSRMYESVTSDKYKDHLNEAEVDAPVYEINNTKDKENMVVEAADSNIEVEWGKYTLNEHEVILNVTIKSADGSPIIEENVNKVPITLGADIETIYVTLDGETKKYLANKKYGEDDSTLVVVGAGETKKIGAGCMALPVTVSEDLSEMTFEIHYENYDVNLIGKELSVAMKNVSIVYNKFEEIGCDMTVGTLLEQGVMARDSDFVECEGEMEIIKDSEGQSYDYMALHGWHLLQGDNRIYFSQKYPECYIDNFGFMPENADGGNDIFFMTLVCDEKSKEGLVNIAFQSAITGFPVNYKMTELEDGRIQLQYNVTTDDAYNELTDGGRNSMDTEWNHLENLVLKKHVSRIMEYVAEGRWETSFTLEGEVNMLETDMNIEVPSYDNQTGSVTVTHMGLDGINLSIEAVTSETFDFMKFGNGKPNTPICIMKDGTSITLDTNGMGGNDNTHIAYFEYLFPTVVNPANVVSIEWHGVTIWSAK